MASNHLHILTLNWQGEDKLKSLAPTLNNSLANRNWTWIVKDNGSSDNSVDYLKSLGDNIRVLETSHNNDSFAKGCNVLFEMANTKENDLVLLLNNDVQFNDQTSLSKMIDLIENDINIGAVGAKLNFPNGKLQHGGIIFDKRYNMLPFHFRPGETEDSNARKNREFQACTGAVLLTRARYYNEINGMDDNFKWCFDDVDLCFSLRYKLNKKIVYCGNTNITHQESATLKRNPVNKLFLSHNVNVFLKKWFGIYTEDHSLYLNNSNYNLYLQ